MLQLCLFKTRKVFFSRNYGSKSQIQEQFILWILRISDYDLFSDAQNTERPIFVKTWRPGQFLPHFFMVILPFYHSATRSLSTSILFAIPWSDSFLIIIFWDMETILEKDSRDLNKEIIPLSMSASKNKHLRYDWFFCEKKLLFQKIQYYCNVIIFNFLIFENLIFGLFYFQEWLFRTVQ